MNLNKLVSIIKEEIQNVLSEKSRFEVDDPRNLHGDERTQEQFVVDLAIKQGGHISLSDISAALGLTNADLKHYGYGRRIAKDIHDKNKKFDVWVPGVPFQTETIYQYVGSEISRDELEKIDKKELTRDEMEKYKAQKPVYYPIKKHTPGKGYATVAYLTLRTDADVKEYAQIFPQTNKYILDKVPFVDFPGKKYKILDAWKFRELCEKLNAGDEKTTFEVKQ